MTIDDDKEYSKALGRRIKKLMKIAGLELSGMVEFTKVSDSHLYAIINGNRALTGKTANKLAKKFGLDVWMLLKLDYKIPQNIRKSTALQEFYRDFKNVPEYFSETRESRKASVFIENEILKNDLFSTPKFIWEISEAFSKKGKLYTSKQLSQILTYLVRKKVLKCEKRPIKLRNGKTGKRIVDVFWK